MTFRLDKAPPLPGVRHDSLLSEVLGVVPRAAVRSARLFFGLAFLLLAAFSPGLGAQSRVFPQWVAPLDVAGNEAIPSAIAADAQGNTYVTGSACASSTDCEMLTIKYDADGRLVWKAWLGNSIHNGKGIDVALDSAGNVFVVGRLDLPAPFNGPEIVTAKYDPNGTRQWADYSGSEVGFVPVKIAVSVHNNIYVIGSVLPNTSPAPGSPSLALTIKYDTAGKMLWKQLVQLAPGPSNIPIGLGINNDETAYIAINSVASPQNEAGQILSITSDGVLNILAGAFLLGYINAFAVDSLGNSYVAGTTSPNGVVGPIVAQFDPQENLVRSFTGDPAMQLAHYSDIAVDSKGNIFVASTRSTGIGNASDISVLKVNADGTFGWQTRYNGHADDSGVDVAVRLAVNFLGEVYVTGTSTSPAAAAGGPSDIVTIKYSTNGTLLWAQRFDDPSHGDDRAVGITIGGDGGLLVTGISNERPSSAGWVTIDYIQDAAKLAPTSLAFGNEALNTQSAAQSVTLTNTSEESLILKSITVTGEFQLRNNCPTTLVAGGSCKLAITFTPTEIGSRSGSVTVLDDWEGSEHSPQTVKLSGTGVAP
jgi:hypothetical protein